MQTWLAVFVVAMSVAVILQTVILAALYFQLKRRLEQTQRILTDLQTRIGPILTRVQILLEDTQPRISDLVADAAHFVYLARTQAQKVDRIFTETADHLRGQLNHFDRILTGTLETLEDSARSGGHLFPITRSDRSSLAFRRFRIRKTLSSGY